MMPSLILAQRDRRGSRFAASFEVSFREVGRSAAEEGGRVAWVHRSTSRIKLSTGWINLG